MTLTAKRSAINNEIDKLYATQTNLIGDLAMLAARQHDVDQEGMTDDELAAALVNLNASLAMNTNGYYERGPNYQGMLVGSSSETPFWNENVLGDFNQVIQRVMQTVDETAPDPATTQGFTTNGTFTWPSGVTTATVHCWGAGGGGGVSGSFAEGGGGGGSYASAVVTKTAATATVGIGVGGTPGVAGTGTNFTQVATINVAGVGGSAGVAQTGGAGGDSTFAIGTTKYDGGDGGNGFMGIMGGGGGGGSSGGTTEIGNNGSSSTGLSGGFGGLTPNGGYAGGNGGDNGVVGTPPISGIGGGGGGGGVGANAGTGGNGYCLIDWGSGGSGGTTSEGTGGTLGEGTLTTAQLLRRGAFNQQINEYYRSKPHHMTDALMLAARQIVEG